MDLSKGKNRKTFQTNKNCAILTKKREKNKEKLSIYCKKHFYFLD